ncbi:hypothetical protein [Enterococcus xiangfangensis]|uniref:hypothetical protein n=1 Tax=Enterococcus xiangfangensis TaxID=1296537 RepID=UPI003D1707DC|nr:hypothetical protein [Enterococcus asini]
MRNDFEYVQTIPVSVATTKARRRSKRTLITGAMTSVFLTGLWQAGLALLGLLLITNLVQKKKD